MNLIQDLYMTITAPLAFNQFYTKALLESDPNKLKENYDKVHAKLYYLGNKNRNKAERLLEHLYHKMYPSLDYSNMALEISTNRS